MKKISFNLAPPRTDRTDTDKKEAHAACTRFSGSSQPCICHECREAVLPLAHSYWPGSAGKGTKLF